VIAKVNLSTPFGDSTKYEPDDPIFKYDCPQSSNSINQKAYVYSVSPPNLVGK